ncbi:hypothetical protein AB1Y20_012996 [Prymnesium parvum]|uniref:Uncharacterized protein n=1 Tax=Prymnesium parvum TaxID=97485 RepID=A0AB34IKW7_PRYPA
MGILSFAGCFAVALSPAATLYAMVIRHEPQLIIVMVGSAFLWLCAISLVALGWALLPLASPSPLLAAAAAAQEASRWLGHALYTRLAGGLSRAGLHAVPSPRRAAPLPLAVASGVGVGAMHVLVLHADVLRRARLPGALYEPSCTHLSAFSLAALRSLGMLLTNLLLSLIGWVAAFPNRSRRLLGAMLLLHCLAAGAALLPGGCVPSLAGLLAAVALTAGLAAHVTLAAVARPELKS